MVHVLVSVKMAWACYAQGRMQLDVMLGASLRNALRYVCEVKSRFAYHSHGKAFHDLDIPFH